MPKKLTTEQFIEKAILIHGDKFDYSKVRYKGCVTKVCIICKIHGEFWQTPDGHTSGKGCKKCANFKSSELCRYTTSEWVEKAKLIHKDLYDYSKVDYRGSKVKVIIICKIHGEFLQAPAQHIAGRGCPRCHGCYKTTTDVIKEFEAIQNDRFDYSKVEYTGCFTKVCIICPIHGEFWQRAGGHLNGNGCPKCVGMNKTTEELILEFRKTHGDKYDYSKVEYTATKTKVCIICPVHGEFWQNVSNHITGNGCPSCSLGGFKSNQSGILYYLKVKQPFNTDKYLYKIGITNNDVKRRFAGNDLGNIEVLKTWHFPIGHSARFAETMILRKFKEFQYKGSPVLKSGNTELFTEDILNLDK